MKNASRESKPSLSDHAAYGKASLNLKRLELDLLGAKSNLDGLTARKGRFSPPIRRVLENSPSFVQTSSGAFEQAAAEIAASGALPDGTARAVRRAVGVPSPLFEDSVDAEGFEEIAEATTAVELVKEAVKIAQRLIQVHKKSAMKAILEQVRGKREGIARRVADATLNLAAVLREEDALTEALRTEDVALPSMLSPGPFPIAPESISGDAMRDWLASALGISEAAIRARIAGEEPVAARGAVQ